MNVVNSAIMEFLPDKQIVEGQLYSEQIDKFLSKLAKDINAGAIQPPRKKFDRNKFLDAIQQAFEQVGGVTRFTIWADQNYGEFVKILGRTIPQAQMIDLVGKMQHQIIRPALPPPAFDADYTEVIDGEVLPQTSLQDEERTRGIDSQGT